jgi:hypothetical protein
MALGDPLFLCRLKKIFFFCFFPVSSYPRQKNSAGFLLLLCACSTKPKEENNNKNNSPHPPSKHRQSSRNFQNWSSRRPKWAP